MKLIRTLCICAVMACFFILVNPASAYWEINSDTVWKEADSPIVTNDSVWIKPGVKLTIDPGVVIKFNAIDHYDRILINQGVLEAIGTPDKPIIFTSIYDDIAGGDTNGDGAATSPKARDWGQLNLQGNNTLNNVIIRYGGHDGSVVVRNYRGNVEIKNSVITKNGAAIANDEGNLTISNSAIYDNPMAGQNYETGIQNSGRVGYIKTVVAQNNWWGTADGPCTWRQLVPSTTPPWQINFPLVCGSKPLIDENITYSPWLTKFPEPENKKLHPVILIPGILGSWIVNGKWELDPILNTYDNLWQALKNAGYEEGKTLFAFPYQWRQSNIISAQQLKDKIIEAKSACIPSNIMDCTKVDLIAHSMGGIVARIYIEGSDYQNDVDKMIFLATPHRGSPSAYLMWEGGSAGSEPLERIMSWVFEIEAELNGYSSISNYVRNFSIKSVQELLPIYNYLRDKDSPDLRLYPNNYPVNVFLEDLNSPADLEKLKDVKIYNYLGDAGIVSTITNLRLVSSINSNGDWSNGYPEAYDSLFGDHGLEMGNGDSTVPKGSNSNFAGASDIVVNSSHLNIVTDAQKEVIKNLTGKEPEYEVRNNPIINVLMIRIFSPADFIVTTPDGKKIGLNVNEIASAFYNHDGGQFAVIPNPIAGEYKIDLIGTGNGSYRLSASYLSDSSSSETNYFGVIAPGQNQQVNFSYSNSGAITSPQKINITIDTSFADVSQIYLLGWLKSKTDKLLIDLAYNGLKIGLNAIDAQIAKSKSDKLIVILKNQRIALINGILDKLNDYIYRLLGKNLLNQNGYDIIKANNDYLKINL